MKLAILPYMHYGKTILTRIFVIIIFLKIGHKTDVVKLLR